MTTSHTTSTAQAGVRSLAQSPLVISGAGAATTLGGIVSSCAAHRAGISHAKADRHMTVFPVGSDEPQPVSVCALPTHSFGFSGVGRFVVLAHESLIDLRAHSAQALEAAGPGLPIFLALPDPLERCIDGLDDEALDVPERVQEFGARVLGALSEVTDFDLTGPHHFFHGEQTAMASALSAAADAIESNQCESCLVGSLDSLLSAPTLEELASRGVLKSASNPVGFIPGEAGCFFLVSRADIAQGDLAGSVQITSLSTQHEPMRPGDGQQPTGRALAQCFAPMIEATDGQMGVILDLNGEVWRSMEWGTALSLVGSPERPANWDLRVPAESFGDVGAAAGGVALCNAIRAFERSYESAPSTVIVNCASSGARSAFLVQRA